MGQQTFLFLEITKFIGTKVIDRNGNFVGGNSNSVITSISLRNSSTRNDEIDLIIKFDEIRTITIMKKSEMKRFVEMIKDSRILEEDKKDA